MAVTIVPATETDAEQLLPVGKLAFRDDLLAIASDAQIPRTPNQEAAHQQFRLDRLRTRLRGEQKFWYKAVDQDSGAVVGFTGIYAPPVDEKQVSGEPKPTSGKEPNIGYVSAIEIHNRQKKLLGDRQDVWYIPSMAVHPDHAGKGIGSKLLAAVVRHADQAHQDVFLASTPAGTRMYLRAGFKALDTINILEGYPIVCMIHTPEKVDT